MYHYSKIDHLSNSCGVEYFARFVAHSHDFQIGVVVRAVFFFTHIKKMRWRGNYFNFSPGKHWYRMVVSMARVNGMSRSDERHACKYKLEFRSLSPTIAMTREPPLFG